jgi:hypothetical protein
MGKVKESIHLLQTFEEINFRFEIKKSHNTIKPKVIALCSLNKNKNNGY